MLMEFSEDFAGCGGDEDSAMPAAAPRMARGPAAQVLRALLRLAGAGGYRGTRLVRHSELPWASITFSGTRHLVTLEFAGDAGVAAGDAFIAALPEHEFTIPRQLVADATVTGAAQELLPVPWLVVEAELLLLEEG